MTALADQSAPADTTLLGKPSVWAPRPMFHALRLEGDDCLRGYPLVAPWLAARGKAVGPYWLNLGEQVNLGGQTNLVVLLPSSHEALGLTSLSDIEPETAPTYLDSAPSFEAAPGTGDLFSDIRKNVLDIWRHVAKPDYPSEAAPSLSRHGIRIAPRTAAEATETLVLDIPAALRQARSQAGLPVQDLAAMFGIGRRQFYNLVEGKQNTDDERAPRIARVTDAIREVSEWVGGNSRKVRALILARVDGDSIYDAAVIDDDDRLGWALERAYSAAAQATPLPRRLSPSRRATPTEAAAVREYLRATRDDSSAVSDE